MRVAARRCRAEARLGTGVLLVAIASSATAAPNLQLHQAAGLPFERRELEEAVDLRVPAAAEGVVSVAPIGPGRIAIDARGRRVEAQLGEKTGPEAARLVAVLLVDVVRTPLVLEESAAPGAVSLLLTPSLSFGVSDGGASFEPTVGVGVRVANRLRLLVSVGYARGQASDKTGALALILDTVPARAGLGLALGPIELQAGAQARGFRAAAGSTALGVRPGGWVGAAWAVPLALPVRPFAVVAADLYFERLELRQGGRPLLTAGHLAPWAGVGLAWTGGAR